MKNRGGIPSRVCYLCAIVLSVAIVCFFALDFATVTVLYGNGKETLFFGKDSFFMAFELLGMPGIFENNTFAPFATVGVAFLCVSGLALLIAATAAGLLAAESGKKKGTASGKAGRAVKILRIIYHSLISLITYGFAVLVFTVTIAAGNAQIEDVRIRFQIGFWLLTACILLLLVFAPTSRLISLLILLGGLSGSAVGIILFSNRNRQRRVDKPAAD
ncbi:MAG: hypothetical protein LBL66_03630 [Clostridiales bacterium]|jgi:hypothetical protein|nr:hypothetical protein [Clostridiales bacterium]